MPDGGAKITQISDLSPDEQQVLEAYRKLPPAPREWLLRVLRDLEDAQPVAPVATSPERAAALAALARVRERRVSTLKLGDRSLPTT